MLNNSNSIYTGYNWCGFDPFQWVEIEAEIEKTVNEFRNYDGDSYYEEHL